MRHPDPDQRLREFRQDFDSYQNLARLLGSPAEPTSEQIEMLWSRPDLTPHQRQIISSILTHPDPDDRIPQLWNNAGAFHRMTAEFGRPPTMDLLNAHREGLDHALARPVPERVEVVRGLRDISFLTIDRFGTQLGSSGDVRQLIGTTQVEPGYTSSSLGARPPAAFDGPIRMEMDVSAGSQGVWMGTRSAFPDQRELILQRGTRYRIVDVIENPPGDRYSGVRYLIRAEVLPPGP
ncbi:ADP-ribosyltransferase [Nocardia cyriacigeorgica]|uniref:ADP-ribosyltransferase n=1 Tax=Nocardia cyriacigeorgica TaxID=135487 RepID=UPI0018937F3D|nr:ADP-ribosyltransferase [Nocardia cyriacigeorgica]MBF6415099.1 hypothetical protein [Nocardia cyriacigeorgica]